MDFNKAKLLHVSIRHAIGFILLVPLLVTFLVVLVSYHRIDEFRNNQEQVARSAVLSVGQEIHRLIEQRERLMGIFVDNEHDLIDQLAREPERDDLLRELETRLRSYFPDFFAYSIIDNSGNAVIDDFQGFIGEICTRDIKLFAETGEQNVQVHPNPYVYHIDMMAKRPSGGFFFTSFNTDLFSRVLYLSSPPGQQLMLTSRVTQNLIEITEQGARINLDRDTYILSDDEIQHILYSLPVGLTNWQLVSLADADLISTYQYSVIRVAVIIIFFAFAGAIGLAWVLWRDEKQRIANAKQKEEMIALFSHDLRTPLSSIYGIMQLFELDVETGRFSENESLLIRDGANSCRHVITLINDLIDLQKLESGTMEFHLEKVSLYQLLDESISTSRQFAESNNVRIETSLAEDVMITADRTRFGQVLSNLLSNAVKYSPDYGVVTVKTVVSASHVEVSVTDKGPGIANDVIDRLFDRFSQSTSNRTREVGGAGLGLSIVRDIVDRHGWTVDFETQRGQGTTFTISIPLA